LPICPKCNKEIDYLQAHCEVVETYNVTIQKDEKTDKTMGLNWDHTDTDSVDNNDDDYCCPLCYAPLFYDSTSAQEFLESKTYEKVC